MSRRRILHRGGTALETLDQGDGPAVFMIASLGRPMEDFDDLAERLTIAGYRALRMQARGIGASTGPMEGVTLADLADEIAHCIADLAATPVVAIGHAFGQRVARMLAARRPELVRAIVAIAAGGKVAMADDVRAALLGCFDPDQSAERHLDCARKAFFAPGGDVRAWRDGWHGQTARMQLASIELGTLADWWAGGTVPMLVIQGLQDQVALPANGRALKQQFGDRVRLVEIDGAGHALLPERPAEIAGAVLEFLRQIDQSRP